MKFSALRIRIDIGAREKIREPLFFSISFVKIKHVVFSDRYPGLGRFRDGQFDRQRHRQRPRLKDDELQVAQDFFDLGNIHGRFYRPGNFSHDHCLAFGARDRPERRLPDVLFS